MPHADFHALRTGTHVCLMSAALALMFNGLFCDCQTEGDRTQMFDHAIEKHLVRLPLGATAQTCLHLAHLRFAHNRRSIHSSSPQQKTNIDSRRPPQKLPCAELNTSSHGVLSTTVHPQRSVIWCTKRQNALSTR